MPGAQMEGEYLVFLVVDAAQDIRLKRELVVVADEPGISAHRHVPDVARAGDEARYLTAGDADAAALGDEIDDDRFRGQALRDRRQFARAHPLGEKGRLHWGRDLRRRWTGCD